MIIGFYRICVILKYDWLCSVLVVFLNVWCVGRVVCVFKIWNKNVFLV